MKTTEAYPLLLDALHEVAPNGVETRSWKGSC